MKSEELRRSKRRLSWVRIPPPALEQTPISERIVNLLLQLQRDGLAETTLKPMGRRLRSLSRFVDLDKPEEVKQFIADQNWSASYKSNMVHAYGHYIKFCGLSWVRPNYKRTERIRKVPREEQINKIIAHASSKYVLAFSVLRDTGLRPVEYTWLRVKDIDLETGLLYPETAKFGAGRVLRMRKSTLAMLKRYIQEKDLKPDDRLCHKVELMTLSWCRNRKKVAANLSEPELMGIRLYDLRHHYGSVLYMKTKDIVYVQRQLGHKRIQHTLRYVHLVDLDAEEYVVKVAVNVGESSQLLEQGFDFVAEIEGKYLFRKVKPASL